MKLLHVVTSIDPRTGGVAESIRSRGLALQELGHSVHVVSLDHANSPFISTYELPIYALGRGKSSWQYHNKLQTWLELNSRSFDAVIVDGIWQYHGLATRNALKKTGTPYYVYPHGMLDPWFRKTFPLKHLKKWLFWPWADYRVLRDAKAVLFTCEEEKLLARNSFWMYSANERVAPLGTLPPPTNTIIDKSIFFRDFPKLFGQSFILFLGRIHPKKGCPELIEAFANASRGNFNQTLVMAGPGEESYITELKASSERLGIGERVFWTGMLEGGAKWGALHACNAFILPSHQENFGIAVIEALACGKPVLISDKVNIWREIADDGCGLICEDSPAGILKLLLEWNGLSECQKTKLQTNAYKSYEMRYTVSASASQLLSVLNQA